MHYRLYIQILHIGHKKSNICGWGYKLIALTEVTNIGNMCFSPCDDRAHSQGTAIRLHLHRAPFVLYMMVTIFMCVG